MMKTFRICTILLCLVNSWFVVAEEIDDLCQIEVIFFEQNDPKRFSSEEWPKFVGKLDTRNAISAADSAVDAQKMLLTEEEKTIKKSKAHTFIQHVAWVQPLTAGVKSTPVHIQAGANNDQINAVLDFKPVRNTYNVGVDIVFRSGESEYRLTRDIKVKKNEMYYIDHPLFGAMLMVHPQEVAVK